MIITRTPYRISLFGGGTDHPSWYRNNGGQVIGFAISKYIYISITQPQRFYDHNYKVVYGKTELTDNIEDIEHPVVRAVLEHYPTAGGIDMNYVGELPARSGMGSSSSFTVGLINAVEHLRGKSHDAMTLAQLATKIEQDILKETVGSQDQVWAAAGGINHIIFHRDDEIERIPIDLEPTLSKQLNAHMMLFFTGVSRSAHEIETRKVSAFSSKKAEMQSLYSMATDAVDIVKNGCDICELGKLLHETWVIKRRLHSRVSSSLIDSLYDKGRDAGALGGKLLGAGGGGFLLLIAPPERHETIRQALTPLVDVKFSFDYSGTKIIYSRKH